MKRTISSLALLKVNWDIPSRRQDFIDIFLPFVATLIVRKNYNDIDANTLCRDFEAEYGFKIPYHPMITILSRASDKGYIWKSILWQYTPNKEELRKIDISNSAQEQERKYQKVLTMFTQFCESKYTEEISELEAENALLTFLKDHDLDILFINPNTDTILPDVSSLITHEYMLNKFIIDCSKSEPEIFNFIVDMTIGHIFANTMLCRELDKYQGDLSNCKFYLDTGLLFNIFGINGEEKKSAFIDFVQLLISNKAKFFVFEHTYEEFRGILENSLYYIDKPYYDSQKASRATIYFVDNNYTPSDVEQFIIKVDGIFNRLKIEIVDIPEPLEDKVYQIDVTKLTDKIIEIYKNNAKYFNEVEKEETIYKDVKSIATINKLRKGRKPNNIQNAEYIFITTNSSLALASKIFETQDSDKTSFFIPTTLTDVFVGTIIWLQSPTIVSKISEKRLIANCYAALQPDREMIKKLTETVDQLRKDKKITEDDAVLLKQSRVARNILQEETLGDPNRFSDKTPFDILNEIKSDIQKEESQKFQKDRESFQSREKDLSDKIESERQRKISAEQKFSQKKEELEKVQNEKMKFIRNIETKSEQLAVIITKLFYIISGIFVVFAIFQFFPNILETSNIIKIISRVTAIILFLTTTVIGFNVRGIGRNLRKWLKQKITNILLKILKY